ncbi:hypothetical protein U5801_24010 [Lamprobacter modestohalophilus]|uniref:hypothetical protein n=1 Tax=Lamprobacter modestohalophilus TaxID=1064514 RepID=UPI002ADEF8AC|nr:hypothetical protein [Lamprobacter modestohalophilus]MEA1052850.1 hypothetical protein [Lamprobacter modestohalophilus]
MSKDDETGDASHIEINEKHLELVQGVINRLAGNGFLVKGWSLTVAVAMIVVIARTDSTALTPVLLIPVFAFWGFDHYFLSRERGFCGLYRRIVQHDPGVPPYLDIKRIDPQLVERLLAHDADHLPWHGPRDGDRLHAAAWRGGIARSSPRVRKSGTSPSTRHGLARWNAAIGCGTIQLARTTGEQHDQAGRGIEHRPGFRARRRGTPRRDDLRLR